jgi:hypothetical protein
MDAVRQEVAADAALLRRGDIHLGSFVEAK